MPIISAVALFCFDKFEDNQNEKVFNIFPNIIVKKVTQKILGSPGLLEGQFNLIWPNCLQFTHCNLSQLSPRCPSSWQISQNSSGFDFDWFLFWTGENAGFDWLSPSLSSFLSGDEKNWFYYKFNFLSDRCIF